MGSGGGNSGHSGRGGRGGKGGHSGRGGRGGKGGHSGGSGKGGHGGRGYGSRSSNFMTAERAAAIQSHADRTGRNEDFKKRAMSAAAKHENEGDFDEDD